MTLPDQSVCHMICVNADFANNTNDYMETLIFFCARPAPQGRFLWRGLPEDCTDDGHHQLVLTVLETMQSSAGTAAVFVHMIHGVTI